MKIDLPEEKKVEEILSTEAERALKEKQRLEDEKEELTWFACPLSCIWSCGAQIG